MAEKTGLLDKTTCLTVTRENKDAAIGSCCKYCGMSLQSAICAALLIDLGCSTNIEPIKCRKSPTKKHDFS